MWHSSLSAKVNMFGVYGDTEVTVAMVAMILHILSVPTFELCIYRSVRKYISSPTFLAQSLAEVFFSQKTHPAVEILIF